MRTPNSSRRKVNLSVKSEVVNKLVLQEAAEPLEFFFTYNDLCPQIKTGAAVPELAEIHAKIKVFIHAQPNSSFSPLPSFDASLSWRNMALKTN